jgi:heme-degrading monooxygenase HmoA
MFARVTTVQADVSRIDEGIAFAREVQPQVDQIPGSRGMAMWVDRASGRCAITVLWADREALEASTDAVAGFRAAVAEHLGGGEPRVEVFEVAVRHLVKPAEPGYWHRSTRCDVPAGDLDQVVEHFQHSVVPAVDKVDGLTAAVLLVDRDSGKALTAVTYDSREALDASRARGQDLRDAAAAEIPTMAITDVTEMEFVIAGLRPQDEPDSR